MDFKRDKTQKPDVKPIVAEPQVETAVVAQRFPVVYYNKWSHIVVYERDGKQVQIFLPEYDGSGFVEVE